METVTAAVEYLEGINLASITMRIVMSMVCGGVIGIERGKAHQPAGMRTYMLVCMGAAMVMLTGQYMYYHFQTGDPARLGAQVVSGIGFLGAGSIIISGKTKIKRLLTRDVCLPWDPVVFPEIVQDSRCVTYIILTMVVCVRLKRRKDRISV